MDAQEVVRKLVEAAHEYFIARKPTSKTMAEALELDAAIDAVEDYLETGGWHKWPEEKPRISGMYNTIGGSFNNEYETEPWINERTSKFLWNDANVHLWQPFPPLPEAEKVVHNSEKDT
jgi:hypothetical protein